MRRNSDKYKYFGSDRGETHKTVICNNCGYYVYKNKKIEFKEKMKERIKKVKENEERNNNYN